jgi:large subunit ribosomal protein L25
MADVLKVTLRTEMGKNAARIFRRSGMVPAVVYARGEPSRELLVNEREFTTQLAAIRGKSTMIDVQVADEPPIKCIVKAIQRHSVTRFLMHVDFQRVHAHEKITISVPIHLAGAPVGLKMGGRLEHVLREIPVRGLPEDLPASITLDVTHLKVGQSLHISDIKLAKAEIQLPLTAPVASILSPRKEEEVAAPTAEAAAPVEGEAPKEPEVIAEKKTAERAEERAKTETATKGGKPAKEEKKPDAKKPEKKEEKKK